MFKATQMVISILIILITAAFPGYSLATLTVDKIGRKIIQRIGFLVMVISSI